MSPDLSLELWKKYLRYDPTRWLLETNDPSILLWYQLDIAHRPEDAPGVLEMRERVLYSDPVQKIFAHQNELGYWGDPESLAHPKFTSTLWNLFFLTELGIPRTSRRARNGCEFILQNFVHANGTFRDLALPECGYALHVLAYFMRHDPRVERIALASLPHWKNTIDDDGTAPALLAWAAFRDDPEFRDMIDEALDEELENMANDSAALVFGFPHFEPWDPHFRLRVVALHDRIHDERAANVLDMVLGYEDERARFPLTENFETRTLAALEPISTESRWSTLNALRVITRLVLAQQK